MTSAGVRTVLVMSLEAGFRGKCPKCHEHFFREEKSCNGISSYKCIECSSCHKDSQYLMSTCKETEDAKCTDHDKIPSGRYVVKEAKGDNDAELADCTQIANAQSSSTYKCKTANDSRFVTGGCRKKFFKHKGKNADVCRPCARVKVRDGQYMRVCDSEKGPEMGNCDAIAHLGFGCKVICDNAHHSHIKDEPRCKHKCQSGYYHAFHQQHGGEKCMACSRPGFMATGCRVTCTSHRDTKIVQCQKKCKDGYFFTHATDSSDVCQACSSAPQGYYQVTPCTPTQDATHRACPFIANAAPYTVVKCSNPKDARLLLLSGHENKKKCRPGFAVKKVKNEEFCEPVHQYRAASTVKKVGDENSTKQPAEATVPAPTKK